MIVVHTDFTAVKRGKLNNYLVAIHDRPGSNAMIVDSAINSIKPNDNVGFDF